MPNTSTHLRKVIKSKEFVDVSDDSNSCEQYNILSRPKRKIIPNINPTINATCSSNDANNNNNNNIIMLDESDDDEEDEDFHCSLDLKSDGSETSNSDESACSSNTNSSSDSKHVEGPNSHDEQIPETKHTDMKTKMGSIKLKIAKPKAKESKLPKKKEPKSQIKQHRLKKSTAIKNKKLKKIIAIKKQESNHEIEKIFSKFKNVNKTKNIQPNRNDTLMIQREKLESILEPDNITNWSCSLCHKKPNETNDSGPLYGPYRVQKTNEDFQEIWLHAECAIWNSSIYIKDNQVYGISHCFAASINSECCCCKKMGATLKCNKLGCNHSYHYPCAIKSKCKLIRDTLSIQCKFHSS